MIKKLSIGEYTLRAEEYISLLDNKKAYGITLYKDGKEVLHSGRTTLKSLNDEDMKKYLEDSIELIEILKGSDIK